MFDVYFLAMMVIQGSVVLTIDARSFKKNGIKFADFNTLT